MGAITITEMDPALDDHVAGYAHVRRLTDIAFEPDDPPVTDEEVAAWLRTPSEFADSRMWLAFDGSDPIALLHAVLERSEANEALVEVEAMAVVPGRRRAGVGTAVLRDALPVLLAADRTSLLGWVGSAEETEGRGFASTLGLTERTEERCSRLDVTSIDDALIDEWIVPSPKADGYRLVQFSGRCPEELLDVYVAAESAMADVPIDDLEWSHTPLTPERVRLREERWAKQGRLPVQTLAIAPDGSAAGLSEIFGRRFRPSIADQGDTGVLPEHRGRGIGRWMKAANLRAAQDQIPELRVVETYNAESNPWMLDINVAMGFRPHVTWFGYQGDTAGALDQITAR